jgi:uncharacterized cupredoxin-like copper-binding protein
MTMTADRLLRAATVIAAVFGALPAAALADAGHDYRSVGEPAKASAGARTVAISLADNFYEPESVQVKAGETVRFVLKNTGELLHEFNIGTAAMHSEHQKEMAVMMEHGMITPTSINRQMMNTDHSMMAGGMTMKHDDPNSILVQPGETKELVWKFTKAVDLEFACNLPGHYEAGMVGKVEFLR